MDQALISTTTTPPVPDPEPHQTRTDYPPNTSSSFRPRRTKVAQRQRLSSAWQSDTGTISDTGAARLSSSTASSTLPPSYRTRRSSVYYMPAPSYPPPPFPPPAYTPPNSHPPPSAFLRTVPRRARGRRLLPTACKPVLQSRDPDKAASQAGLESDGTRSESTRRGENSVEGSGTEERLVASAFSDSKNGSQARSLDDSRQDDFFTDTVAAANCNVSETGGATIRPTGRED
ncbi:hypothetical protein LXA43DRAFT_74120 [Ganoderma leucocontextum]|nr:hypothetical protein LXA43DRAFT_74120 [Ganoderma leucocontextum]